MRKKQGHNPKGESHESLYAGIDLHSNNNVVESTYNWYWLVDGLMEQGYRVHLANTGAIQQYAGLKYSDDKSEARWLAKLLSDADAHEMLGEADVALAVQSSLAVIRCQSAQIEQIEKRVLKRARVRPEFRILLTVTGIGTILGLTIMLEVGDIGRFPAVGNFASYVRCVESRRISNGKKKGKSNSKNGNRYLGWAFMEAAGFASRYDETIRRYHQRKRAKAHAMVARKAVAHKLARACYHMLREQTVFDVNRAFG